MYQKLHKFRVIVLLLTLSVLFISCKKNTNSKAQLNLTDDMGNIIQKKVPSRVVSLAPSITELLYFLNEDKSLIADTKYCDYPNDAKNKLKVGNMLSVDYEKILSIKPDIVFMVGFEGSNVHYDKLKQLGLNVYLFKINNFEDVKTNFQKIAAIYNKENFASETIQQWNSRLEKIEKAPKQHLRGLFLVSSFPPIAASDSTFINDILRYAGIQNICKYTKTQYPMYSQEEILRMNPEIIFTRDKKEDIISTYNSWLSLAAFKNNKVYFYDENIYHRPGPRFVDAVEMLYKQINQ